MGGDTIMRVISDVAWWWRRLKVAEGRSCESDL